MSVDHPAIPSGRSGTISRWKRQLAAGSAARWPHIALVLVFSVLFFLNAVAAAHIRPFRHDEIFTVLIARLPSVATVWRAVGDGLDFMPPLNAIVTRALGQVLGEGPIVTRIPPMIGVWLACLTVFGIVGRRSNLVLGVSAAMMLLWTAAFRYAVEARGYGLMLGLFGVSALAWSEATRGTWRKACLPLLALSLAAGVWAHYYAALNIVPLALGEVVRDVRRRTPDWGVWAAFAVAVGCTLPLVVLAGSALSHVGRPWTLVEPVGVRDTYAFLLLPLVEKPRLGALFLLGVLGRIVRVTTHGPTEGPRIPVHEVVATAACLLIPVAGVLAGRLGIGVFTQRYALSVVMGAVPAVLLAVWAGSGRNRLVAWIVCAFLALSFAQTTRAGFAVLGTPYPNPVAERPALAQALTGGEDVCVTGALMYLQFWYYTPPTLRPRLHYLVDPATARRLTGTDSLDNGLAALRRWSDVTAPDYDRFVSVHPRFTVYGAGSGWLLERLRESGASVRETGVEMGVRIYDVVLPGPAGGARTDASGRSPALLAAVR